MKGEVSYIIFYGHKIWAVPVNNIALIRKVTLAAIRSYSEKDKKGEGND